MGKLFSGLKKGRLCDPLRRFFFMINGLKKLVEFYLIGCFLKLSKYSIKVEKLSDLFRIKAVFERRCLSINERSLRVLLMSRKMLFNDFSNVLW